MDFLKAGEGRSKGMVTKQEAPLKALPVFKGTIWLRVFKYSEGKKAPQPGIEPGSQG